MSNIKQYFLICFTVLFVTSCKVKEASPQEDTSNGITEQQINKVRNEYQSIFLNTDMATVPWDGNAGNCEAGTPDLTAQNSTLIRINYFRKLAGLEWINELKPEWNLKCQEAALMMHANSQLSHSPPMSWSCYTNDGAQAALSSNLAGSAGPTAILRYMQDAGGGNYAVGHRRYILKTNTVSMGHGCTNKYDALWVVGGSGTPANPPEFVTWPPKIVPAPLVWPRWSFSKPGANFSSATVSMTDDSGNSIANSVISKEDTFGDPSIVWEPASFDLTTDKKVYNVVVSNVSLNGEMKEYSYSVMILKMN